MIGRHILHGFNINHNEITNVKKDKSSYIIHLRNGAKKISKMHENPQKIEFIHNTKEHLIKHNFTNIDRFNLTPQNKPYYFSDGSLYTMTDYIGSSHVDFLDVHHLTNSIKTFANMHKLSKNNNINNRAEPLIPNLLNTYQKGLMDINSIRKKLKNSKKLSDFDIIFINNYDYYKSKIQNSIDILESVDINSKHNIQPINYICHNLLKEENLIINGDNIHLINFNEVSINSFIFDIAYFVRRYIKILPENHISIHKLLETYNDTHPIDLEDIKILYTILNYPSKYLNICKQYYIKKRTWVPNIMNVKILEIIEQKTTYENYINLIEF